jgi:CAAX protease family protein
VTQERQDDSQWLHGLAFVLIVAIAWSVPTLRQWPALWLVPLAAYLLLVLVVPRLRHSFRVWRFGAVTPTSIVATALITVLSCGALIAFHHYSQPDLSRYAGRLPIMALGGVAAAGVIFSIVNATCEEVFFRGILYDSMESISGRGVAIVLTAAVFGRGHMEGYPPGVLGAVLAGFYRLALGVLRAFTGGIGLGIIAHIAADATIFTLLARSNAW